MENFDLLICGAGPVGCTIANRAAEVLGWSSLIIEKRHHIAGNCFDENHPTGVMIHRYGPHYFRTNNDDLLAWLSRYTDWVPGNYIVKSFSRGEYFPFPINLLTLEQFFKRSFTAESAAAFLDSISEKFPKPKNSEEFVLSRVGREMYEAFYKGYTLKQWEVHPKDLAPSVCGRIPIRFNHDCRYVDHKHQVTPKHGFTAMFGKMIDNPKISVQLNTDYRDVRKALTPKIATVYSGPIDEFFDYTFGRLPWRSLEFDFKPFQEKYRQECVQINYPNDFEYTRTVEIKHVTHQECPNTVVSYEYSRSSGDPYYPIPSSSSDKLFKQYWELAKNEELKKNVYFGGRLATYRYLNTDQVLEEALALFERIKREHT